MSAICAPAPIPCTGMGKEHTDIRSAPHSVVTTSGSARLHGRHNRTPAECAAAHACGRWQTALGGKLRFKPQELFEQPTLPGAASIRR